MGHRGGGEKGKCIINGTKVKRSIGAENENAVTSEGPPVVGRWGKGRRETPSLYGKEIKRGGEYKALWG